MAEGLRQWLDRLILRRALSRWTARAEQARTLPLAELPRWRNLARRSRRPLDLMISEADRRLSQPLVPPAGAARRLPGTDWLWRPDPWTSALALPGQSLPEQGSPLADGCTLYHDCPEAALCYRQIRNSDSSQPAAFALQLEAFHFKGSYLSLVIDLPDEVIQGLHLRHLLRIDLVTEAEVPCPVYLRLNIRHGPNTEQILQELPGDGAESFAEFDLAYSRVNERRIEKLWIDVIFDPPVMNKITLRDLSLSRRPRAAM